MDGLIEKTFVWELRSSPAQLWPVLSDTPRLNEALDLPLYRISETFDGEGQRRRYGGMQEDGVQIRWEEPPFEWVEGHWWRWRRFYDSGPLRETGGTLLLKPNESGGTSASYILCAEPNGTLGRFLISSGHLKIAAEAFEKIVRRADSFCQKPVGDFYSNLFAERASAKRVPEIDCQTRKADDIKLLAQLGAWLAVAPQADVSELRPRRLARSLGISDAEALRACLLGVEGGALHRQYRVTCTACRVGAITFGTLSEIPHMLACPHCGSGFLRDLTGNCEALFSVDPSFRKIPQGSYCGSGVTRRPHVLLQQNIGAMERREIDFAMAPVSCIARVTDGPVSEPFVMQGGADIKILGDSVSVDTGEDIQGVIVENHQTVPATISLERRSVDAEALLVADLLADPGFRELCDTEVLGEGEIAEAGFGTVVVISPLEGLLQRHIDTANERGGAVCGHDALSVSLVFLDHDSGMGFANELSVFLPNSRIGVDCGLLTAETVDGRLRYTGRVSENARALCMSATPGRVRSSTRASQSQTAPDMAAEAVS